MNKPALKLLALALGCALGGVAGYETELDNLDPVLAPVALLLIGWSGYRLIKKEGPQS